MTTTNPSPTVPSGNSGRDASVAFTCSGGCERRVMRPTGPASLCTTHFWLLDTLAIERCATTAELALVRERAEYVRARITDLLRRTGVDDAESLIAALSGI